MSAIDVLAVIISLLILVKIGVILLAGPKVWIKVPEFLMKHKQVTILIYSLGVLVSGYYLLTVLSVTQVMAAVLFSTLLLGVSLAPYYDHILKAVQKSMPDRKSVVSKFWVQLIFWVILAIAVLWEVFVK
ncbi:MAG: hypothetical protein AABY40_01050 [Nanoarchaeota archaeon]